MIFAPSIGQTMPYFLTFLTWYPFNINSLYSTKFGLQIYSTVLPQMAVSADHVLKKIVYGPGTGWSLFR